MLDHTLTRAGKPIQLEVEGYFPDFRYRLRFSHKPEGWSLGNVQVFHEGIALVTRQSLKRTYPTETEMIDHALSWCDSIARQLLGGGMFERELSHRGN